MDSIFVAAGNEQPRLKATIRVSYSARPRHATRLVEVPRVVFKFSLGMVEETRCDAYA
jgi:hypothetical protein